MTCVTLDRLEWRDRAAAHHQRAAALSGGHRRRAGSGRTHLVEDFLFVYYRNSPQKLSVWHPGAAVRLRDAAERADWPYYVGWADRTGSGLQVDVDAFVRAHPDRIGGIRDVLERTAAATPFFGCFGLHEWAMVYQAADRRRHAAVPLRLSDSATDEVLRGHQLRCSHFDAVRFFTEPALPRNASAAPVDSRRLGEQPGCLHATMDLYKWAYRLGPLVPGELLLDCFELARQIREVDMRASPYDLTALGYRPIEIETAAGKAEYVAAQRDFAGQGAVLRQRLLAGLESVDTRS